MLILKSPRKSINSIDDQLFTLKVSNALKDDGLTEGRS